MFCKLRTFDQVASGGWEGWLGRSEGEHQRARTEDRPTFARLHRHAQYLGLPLQFVQSGHVQVLACAPTRARHVTLVLHLKDIAIQRRPDDSCAPTSTPTHKADQQQRCKTKQTSTMSQVLILRTPPTRPLRRGKCFATTRGRSAAGRTRRSCCHWLPIRGRAYRLHRHHAEEALRCIAVRPAAPSMERSCRDSPHALAHHSHQYLRCQVPRLKIVSASSTPIQGFYRFCDSASKTTLLDFPFSSVSSMLPNLDCVIL